MPSEIHAASGEFVLQTSEAEYRSQHLLEFVRHVRTCFCCAALVNPLFLLSDWRFYGQTHFAWAMCGRAAIELASLAGLLALSRATTFRRYQLICIAWTCLVIPASAILVSPPTDIALLVSFILPAVFYLGLPVSFGWALAFGLGCTAATLAARLPAAPLTRASFGIIAGMVMDNVVFWMALTRSNRLRRLEWAATCAAHKANKKLEEHRDMLQKIVLAAPTPLIITDKANGRLLQANDAAGECFGPGLRDGSLKFEDCINPRDQAKLAERLRLSGQIEDCEIRLCLPDGAVKDMLVAATNVSIGDEEAVLTILVDITRRKEYVELMESLANTDTLCGLANRAHFFSIAAEEIKRAKRYSRPLAVCMVDIDYFKRINDTFGHEAGDLVLKSIASLFRAWVRCQDTIARLGGEEFGILLPETEASSALALVDRLRQSVEEMRVKGVPVPITISVGVSDVLPGETTVDAALSRADQAMYAAKRSGRNRALPYEDAQLA